MSGPNYKVQMERGPEEEKADLGPLPVIPELTMTDGERYKYYAEQHKAHQGQREQEAMNKARAMDDALCQQELIRAGFSKLSIQFIRDSAQIQGLTLRAFMNKEPF